MKYMPNCLQNGLFYDKILYFATRRFKWCQMMENHLDSVSQSLGLTDHFIVAATSQIPGRQEAGDDKTDI